MNIEAPQHQFERLPGGLRVLAPAKVNLNLLVGPRRPDGYHPVDSIVCKVTFFDRLELSLRDDGKVGFRCQGAECGPDERNLAFRAAELAKRRWAGKAGVDIVLTKNIPPGKGLGGGSSDAAAVLAGLNELWRLGLPADELASMAIELGSDVPLFLGPPGARMTGRGEVLQPVSVHPFLAVLYLPDCLCPTAEVYRAYDAGEVVMGRQIDLRELAAKPPSAWRSRLVNQLAAPARTVSPRLAAQWDRLAAAVKQPVHLTGSGSALFVLCDDEGEARDAVARAPQDLGTRCVIVQPNAW